MELQLTMSSSVLWTLLGAALCLGASGLCSGLESRPTSHVKAVIVSRQDEDGKWINEVTLEHGTEQTPWKVEVEQNTVVRGIDGHQEELVQLTAVLTGPPSPVPKQLPPHNLRIEDFHFGPNPKKDVGDDIEELVNHGPESEYKRFVGFSSSYKLYGPWMDWMEANRTCTEEGGHLVIINSEREAGLLGKLLHDIGGEADKGAFIGLTDEAQEGTWLTVLGEPIEDSGFARWFRYDQPDNYDGDENCAIIVPSEYPSLNDVPCSMTCYSICEKEEESSEIATPNLPTSKEPDEEFIVDQQRYLFHVGKDMTWDEAKLECEQKAGYLAIINSEEESHALMLVLRRHYKNVQSAFLGITDRETEGKFKTIFDKPLEETGFTRWFRADQPQNDKSFTDEGENCGAIHSRNGGLNDVPCDQKQPFFCELAPHISKNQEQTEVHPHDDITQTPNPDPIALGYELHPMLKSYYKLHAGMDGKNGEEAQTVCQEEGGSLAKVNSAEEFEFLKTLLTRLRNNFWNMAYVETEEQFQGDNDGPSYVDSEGKPWPLCDIMMENSVTSEKVPCRPGLPFICEIVQEHFSAGNQAAEVVSNEMGNSDDSSSSLS